MKNPYDIITTEDQYGRPTTITLFDDGSVKFECQSNVIELGEEVAAASITALAEVPIRSANLQGYTQGIQQGTEGIRDATSIVHDMVEAHMETKSNLRACAYCLAFSIALNIIMLVIIIAKVSFM